jgi:heme oxygenase (biliverdin-IX-beta and delta-forming)
MLSQLLKERTLSAHQALEKVIVGKIKNLSSPEDYADLLRIFYGFYNAIEQQLDHLDLQAVLPDYSSRRKSDAPLNDLAALGQIPQSGLSAEHVPVLSDSDRAIGALYVLEGSTLGGQIIARMISDRLGEPVAQALSFFSGYGEATTPMWLAFKIALDSIPDENNRQENVVLAANETFEHFNLWARQYELKD